MQESITKVQPLRLLRLNVTEKDIADIEKLQLASLKRLLRLCMQEYQKIVNMISDAAVLDNDISDGYWSNLEINSCKINQCDENTLSEMDCVALPVFRTLPEDAKICIKGIDHPVMKYHSENICTESP